MHTILVVDDDPLVSGFIGSTLREMGLTVLTADRMDAALTTILRHRDEIDLAIVDMVMPGGSGLDLAAEMGRQWDKMQVLYVSGHHDSVAMEAIARRSPENVLLKPFSDQELATRVVQLLARQHAGSWRETPAIPKAS